MQDEIAVGKTCAWSLVPDRALVLYKSHIYERRGRYGCTRAFWNGSEFRAYCDRYIGAYSWDDQADEDDPTIIALEVPVDATAEHLRSIAEHFEACEAAITLLPEVLTRRDVSDLLYVSPSVADTEIGRAYPGLSEPWDREAVRPWLLAELVDMTPQEVRMGVERTLGLRALRGQAPAAGGA